MGRITVNFVESRLAPSKDYEIREFLLIRDVEKVCFYYEFLKTRILLNLT